MNKTKRQITEKKLIEFTAYKKNTNLTTSSNV